MLQRLTPVTQDTILVEHRQGHAVKMEDGQAKNQPVRVSYMNAWAERIPSFFYVFVSSLEYHYL